MITLKNKIGAYVTLTPIGAGIVSVVVPDKNGNLVDVLIGYQSEDSYKDDSPYSGKIPGRFSNRIANGRFSLNGKEYVLPINCGPNHLHGGPYGFANRVWNVESSTSDKVVFSLFSPDGEMGYPGDLKVSAIYTWSDDCVLRLEIQANTSADTVVNLTNHAYWNIEGESSGTMLDQNLWLGASKWLPTDESLVPTGELADVEGTPMDFTSPKKIGADIRADFPALKYGNGYDNCWVVDNWSKELMEQGTLLHMATLSPSENSKTGISLDVYSNQPAIQIYTANSLSEAPIGKSGRRYLDNGGVAIECQGYPDSPNKPQFPSSILKPNEKYYVVIEYHLKNNP